MRDTGEGAQTTDVQGTCARAAVIYGNMADLEPPRPTTPDWHPSWGAWCETGGVHFRVWAPTRRSVEVVTDTPGRQSVVHPLNSAADGTFCGIVENLCAGNRYRYRLDGGELYPDPASRFQPEGVHGPSAVVDPKRFCWSDAGWRGVGLDELVVYELHVGTFTPAGTFAGVTQQLPYLRALGVTGIELMPVADFPGTRSWGYDGVALFAPARCYGSPDDLRRLVDTAHRTGLAVILDVVYNHLGPDGAYLGMFSPYYFSRRHRTPWGAAINLDARHSEMVRAFFIENALHWVHEYHFDGLRLDATHALFDDSSRHFLAELAKRVRASVRGRPVLVIAEDHRNLARLVGPEADGGWGLDAVWADDFHHQIRRGLAGDRDGYYRDFTGSLPDLATTLRQGWFYCGQQSPHFGAPRGTDPTGLSPRRFVICLDNHDQVGNRAFGERLNHQIGLAAYRAATVLLLCAPHTPLLFMGQEWAASTPFQFFTDHNPELGKLVTAGRRREFKDFAAFADPQVRERIPDPQDSATFTRSRLDWSEPDQDPHASILRLYRALLDLRRTEPLLRVAGWEGFDAVPVNDSAMLVVRSDEAIGVLLIVIQMHNAGSVALGATRWPLPRVRWQLVLSTEDPAFTPDPTPVRMELSQTVPVLHFAREGAVLLKGGQTVSTAPATGGGRDTRRLTRTWPTM